MANPKERQIKAIAAELDDLLVGLQATVRALTDVLTAPPAGEPDAGKESVPS